MYTVQSAWRAGDDPLKRSSCGSHWRPGRRRSTGRVRLWHERSGQRTGHIGGRSPFARHVWLGALRPGRRRWRCVRGTRTLMSVGGVPLPRWRVWNIGHDHNYVVIIISRRLGASVMHCWTMSGRLVSVVSRGLRRMFRLLLTNLQTQHPNSYFTAESTGGTWASLSLAVCKHK